MQYLHLSLLNYKYMCNAIFIIVKNGWCSWLKGYMKYYAHRGGFLRKYCKNSRRPFRPTQGREGLFELCCGFAQHLE